MITARYSEPTPGQNRVFRTFEIVYPATATDDEIWRRAELAVFGVDCPRAAQIVSATRLGRLLLGLTLGLVWLLLAALPQTKAQPRGRRASR